MRKENRIDFPIPDDILVERGFKVPMLGIECSPGDPIIGNVERKLIYYRDFHVRQGNISEFLRRFIV